MFKTIIKGICIGSALLGLLVAFSCIAVGTDDDDEIGG